jgi:pilus assembly protein CpaF
MSGLGEFRTISPRPFFLRRLKDYAGPQAEAALC